MTFYLFIADVQEYQCGHIFSSAFSLKLGKFISKLTFVKNINIHVCMHLSKPHSPLLLSTIQNNQKSISQEEDRCIDATREAYSK